jgi:hypothetical protein
MTPIEKSVLSKNGAHAPLLTPPALPPRLGRGHQPKIGEAVAALRAEKLLPPHLRPVQRNRLIIEWLIAAGYGNDLPSPRAIARWFEDEQVAIQSAAIAAIAK